MTAVDGVSHHRELWLDLMIGGTCFAAAATRRSARADPLRLSRIAGDPRPDMCFSCLLTDPTNFQP